MAGRADLADAVDAQRAPGVPVDVAGHEVPPRPHAHEAVRVDPALGLAALPVDVAQADALGLAAHPGQLDQQPGVDPVGRAAVELGGHALDRPHPFDQRRREDLLELGQGRDGRLVEAAHAAVGRRPQAQGHGDGLVVVEEQRRQAAAPAQLVAAVRADLGVDGVAQVAQAGDVAAYRAGRDLEPLGQLGRSPGGPGLEEREQAQEARRGVGHGDHLRR
nr:hypothetical protein [Iamia sp. SCSIO 61187]